MRNLLRLIALVAPLLMAWAGPASATDGTRSDLEEKLKTYDPEIVDAAKSYVKVLDYRARIDKMMSVIAGQMTQMLKAKNPDLSDQQRKQFLDIAFHYVVADNIDLIEDVWILDAVSIYSKEELLALRDFYASPTGLSITQKSGRMAEKVVPDMAKVMQSVMPSAFQAAQSTMRSNGVEVKF